MCSLVQSRVTTLVFLTAGGITVYFDVHQPIEVCHGGTEKRKKLFLRASVAKRSSPEISEALYVYLKRGS